MKSKLKIIEKSGTGRASKVMDFDRGCSLQAVVTGTATYSIQWSNDSGNNWEDHDTMSGLSASANGAFTVPVHRIAVNISSGTGSVKLSVKGS